MHLSVGAGLLANAVVLLWGWRLDVDRSPAPRGNAVLDASRHLDDADAVLGADWLANACIHRHLHSRTTAFASKPAPTDRVKASDPR
jgi:hypothetical protein